MEDNRVRVRSKELIQLALDLDSKLDYIWMELLCCKVYNKANFEDKKYLDEIKDIMQTLEQQMQNEMEATETN